MKKFDHSTVTIVAGIFKQSNHRRLKIGRTTSNFCDVLWISNIAELLVIKFSIMDPVILYFQISIKNRNICAIVSQKLQNTDTFVAKITISAHPNFVHFLGLFVQGVF